MPSASIGSSPSKTRGLRGVAAPSAAHYIGQLTNSDDELIYSDGSSANPSGQKAKKMLLGLLLFLSVIGQLLFGYFIVERRRRESQQPEQFSFAPPGYDNVWSWAIDLTVCSSCFTVAQFAFSYFVQPIVFAVIPQKKHWSPESYEMRVARATSAAFKLIYHSCSSLFWIWILPQESWARDFPLVKCFRENDLKCFATDVGRGLFREKQSADFWKQFWERPADVGPDVTWYYVLATGYSISEMIMIFPERARSDFLEMCLHHTITIGLTIFSFSSGFIRMGSLVMFVHTLSDVFIWYNRMTVDVNSPAMMTLWLIALCASFFWLRLCVFPFVLVRSAYTDGPRYLLDPVHIELVRPFCMMLSVLVMLHWYWWCMIVRTGWNFAKTGQARDLASQFSVLNLKRFRSSSSSKAKSQGGGGGGGSLGKNIKRA